MGAGLCSERLLQEASANDSGAEPQGEGTVRNHQQPPLPGMPSARRSCSPPGTDPKTPSPKNRKTSDLAEASNEDVSAPHESRLLTPWDVLR